MELPTTRPGLVLIELRPEDSGALFALIDRNREHLSKLEDDTAEKYPDEASVLKSICSPTDSRRKRFGIWDNDVLVGSANLTIEGLGVTKALLAKLGYYVGQEYTGRSYATAAARTLCNYAFDTLNCVSIYAYVHEQNRASRKVLEVCGLRYVNRIAGGTDLRYILHKKDR